ncbi:zinc-ribbon domain-containing protein [Candidatus Pelagibacter sp.]|uniref:zinc-ribbon domain-containing protein n=1 Tax=Candidatus Pelagibacter sp. TaxID=2024849 RepID=UPI003F830708
MIISCQNCLKKFDVEDNLIPENGRMLQCSSCDHKWFFKTSNTNEAIVSEEVIPANHGNFNNYEQIETDSANVNEINSKFSNLNFGAVFIKTLAYFIVSIITLTAFLIILDTFKSPLSGIFPNLELYLFNLIEILKDVKFFIKDLIF